jgi:hypothetical protein
MVARSMDGVRKTSLLALTALALALPGCGEDAKTKQSRADIRQVVTRFAAAHDASACNLLTDDGLRNVYGGFTASPAKAKRNCIARSTRFKGEAVKVTQINFTDANTAKAGALGANGKVAYTVTLRRSGNSRWRINQITQGKPK